MTTLAHAHINNVRGYNSVNLEKVRQKITAQAQASMATFSNDPEILNVKRIGKILGSNEFLEVYNECFCEVINEAFQESYSSVSSISSDFFLPGSNAKFANVGLTNLGTSKFGETQIQADKLINNLRSAFSYLNLDANFSMDNKNFFKELSQLTEFQDIKPYCDELQKYMPIMYEAHESGARGIKGSTKSWLKSVNKLLSSGIGPYLWEQLTLKAREKALDFFFNMNNTILSDFRAKGFTVKVSGKQTGNERIGSKKQQQIADSVVNIDVYDNGDNLIARVQTGDSTKLSQSFAQLHKKANMFGSYKIKTLAGTTLESVLRKIDENGTSEYWQERLGAYLTSNNSLASFSSDNAPMNWEDTKKGLALQLAYDTLATRVGGGVQSLTFNERIYNIATLYNWAANSNKVDAVGQIGNISEFGGGYAEYVKRQRFVDNKTDSTAINNYSDYIRKVMATKISISINMVSLLG